MTASGLHDPDSTPGNHDPGEDDQASATLNSRGVADLSLFKTVDPNSAVLGERITYTLTVSNAGPDAASGVIVRDQLPAGLTWVSDSGGYDHVTGAWEVGSLRVGHSATLTIVATVGKTGTIANTAEVVASDQRDPDSTPNNGKPGEDDQSKVVLGARNPTPPPTTIQPVEPPAEPGQVGWLAALALLLGIVGLAMARAGFKETMARRRR